MSLIVEIIIAVCLLTGLYMALSRLLDSQRIHDYSRHLYEQFVKNLDGDPCKEKSRL
ncbi:hypothetical protein PAECIP112173_03264 [Paenibacillus sp. JJ-100]|nr:hypothetical protein PAECIP112173_03264 [Paenibacillus sp. JJ-100]